MLSVTEDWLWPTAGAEATGVHDSSSSRTCHSSREGGYGLQSCRPVALAGQPWSTRRAVRLIAT
jgi:hypothetical protein